jgi:hypothetical protein
MDPDEGYFPGLEGVPKYFYETMQARAERYHKALTEIRDMDYRGNRHPSAQMAADALKDQV